MYTHVAQNTTGTFCCTATCAWDSRPSHTKTCCVGQNPMASAGRNACNRPMSVQQRGAQTQQSLGLKKLWFLANTLAGNKKSHQKWEQCDNNIVVKRKNHSWHSSRICLNFRDIQQFLTRMWWVFSSQSHTRENNFTQRSQSFGQVATSQKREKFHLHDNELQWWNQKCLGWKAGPIKLLCELRPLATKARSLLPGEANCAQTPTNHTCRYSYNVK